MKAQRLRAFLDFLGREYGGRVEAMAGEDPWELRGKLLAVNGIGPETADAIALYAAGRPLFVVDAYTRRVFSRLGFLRGDEGYGEVQRFFMEHLPAEVALFQDYHAQIVRLAKDVCRPVPRCDECVLDDVRHARRPKHGGRPVKSRGGGGAARGGHRGADRGPRVLRAVRGLGLGRAAARRAPLHCRPSNRTPSGRTGATGAPS